MGWESGPGSGAANNPFQAPSQGSVPRQGILVSDTLLDGNVDGDRLKLAGTGDWVAHNARRLESEVDSASRRYRLVKRVDIDMGGVERLDTFGAWLLERLQRAYAARGSPRAGR